MNVPVGSHKRLRVVLATDSGNPSGVGEHMLTLAQGLQATHEIVLLFADDHIGRAFMTRAAHLTFETKALPAEAEEISSWLRNACIDLIHVHAGIGWEGHGLTRAAHAVGVAIVRTEHLPYLLTDGTQRREHRDTMCLVDHVIAVSDASAQTYKREGAAHDRLTTIRNGIAAPTPSLSRDDVRSLLGIAADDLLILMVARFTPQKGHAVLLAAMGEVLAWFPDARLLLAGDGEEREKMQRVVHESKLEERVTFLGERDDVSNLLAAADLFALPSFFEGLPLAVLEAMALGVPVVATRVGGTEEALGPGHPWYAAPHDAVSLAARIIEALADENQRGLVGARGRERFEAGYQASRMAAETATVYRRVKEMPVSGIGRRAS